MLGLLLLLLLLPLLQLLLMPLLLLPGVVVDERHTGLTSESASLSASRRVVSGR